MIALVDTLQRHMKLMIHSRSFLFKIKHITTSVHEVTLSRDSPHF